MVKTISPIFRKLFQTVKDPVLILNTSCQIESINDFAAHMLNLDKTTKQQLPMDEQSMSIWSVFVKKIKVQKSAVCVLNILTDVNQYEEVKIMGYYHEGKDLIFSRISKILIDESTESNFYSLLNDIQHGIVLTSISGEIVDINDEALSYLQCEKSQIINQQHESIFKNLLDYDYSKLHYFADISNIGRASLHVSTVNEQGENLYLKLDSKLNYKTSMIVTTITDETERYLLKQKQEQIEEQHNLINFEEMAASIAHEIRNPMTSLKGFVDLLKSNTTIDGQKYLQVMDSELHRMESILTELLHISKPVEHQFNEISLLNVVEEVVEIMLPHAYRENIKLNINNHAYYGDIIFGNKNRLKQMLINLVKNAIEVMPHGGTININLEIVNDQVTLTVKDEGPGITKQQQKSLFTPFYTTKETGTGLGLVLVKKVIEEHSGSVCVESMIGEGTTFVINFPLCEKQQVTNDELVHDIWFKTQNMGRLPIV